MIIKKYTLLHYRRKIFDNSNLYLLIEKSKIFRQGLVNLIDTYCDNADAKARLRASLTILDLRVPDNKLQSGHTISDKTLAQLPDNILGNQMAGATPSIFEGD